VTIILILWGLVGLIVESVSEDVRITPRGLSGSTLLAMGLLFGAVGQVLFRLALRIEILELRLNKLSENASKGPSS
jgi:hypothetical protein